MVFYSSKEADEIKRIIKTTTCFQGAKLKIKCSTWDRLNKIFSCFLGQKIILSMIINGFPSSAVFIGKIVEHQCGSMIKGIFRLPVRSFSIFMIPMLLFEIFLLSSDFSLKGAMIMIGATIVGVLWLYFGSMALLQINSKAKSTIIAYITDHLC